MILFKNFFNSRKTVEKQETIEPITTFGFSSGLLENMGFSDIETNWEYFYYCYLNCTALNTAISWVVNHANQIELKGFVKMQDVWFVSYLVTGNLFLLKFSENVYSYIPTKNILIANNSYKFVGLSLDYEFDSEGEGLNNPYKLIHLKNKGLETGLSYGYSFLQPILNEIRILMCGSIHNVSLLKNGAMPSNVISSKVRVDEKIWESFKNHWNNLFKGSRNSGKTAFLNGGEFDVKAIQSTNQEMQYLDLIKRAETFVYKQFKMPLPLIETERQTFSNYSEAQAQLYENMVIPIFVSIIDQLKEILKKDDIFYDVETLPLQAKTLLTKMAADMNKAGVLTINEIRTAIKYPPLIGGDIIRSNVTQPIAYASDEFGDENLFPDTENE